MNTIRLLVQKDGFGILEEVLVMLVVLFGK